MDIEKLKKQLIEHEGLRVKPYRCTAGKLTIGVGRNIEEKGITEGEAMYLLENDISECWLDAEKIFPAFSELSEERQHAIIDMRFNLGAAGFRKFQKFIDAVRKGQFERAADEMVKSWWYVQVGKRAVKLVKMMIGVE